MWLVWSVALGSAVVAAAAFVVLLGAARSIPLGWRALAASGIPLAVAGLGFVVRFWDPTSGPYRADVLYPFGAHLNAWAVSFGFLWLAFGLVFCALALLAPRTRLTWLVLLLAWFLSWLPHGIIGIGFATAGSDGPSLRSYREWAFEWRGLVKVALGGLSLLAHFALAIGGFVATGWALFRAPRRKVS